MWSQIGAVFATNSILTDFSDTNVMANTTNWYRVRAFNSASASGYSDAASLAATVPAPPIVSGKVFANTVTLSWYDGTGSATSVAGYQLERALDNNGSPGAWTQITNTPDSGYTDNGRAADTTYWYRVRSHNWIGDSDYSDPMSATISPPAQPSNLFAALDATNAVVLRWHDFDYDEDGFKIERVADAGGYPGDSWQEIGSVDSHHASDASFVDTNVVANTTNWYRVRAFSAAGFSDYDGDAEVRVIPPAPPAELSASPNKNTITVSWFESFGIGSGGFVVQRAPDNGGVAGTWTDIATKGAFDMSYNDAGLPTGAKYWYRVRSFNWVGLSDYSSLDSAIVPGIIPPTTPYSLYCDPGSLTNQVFLTWYDIAADEDGFRIQRAPDVGGAPGIWTEIGTIYATNFSFAGFTDTNAPANSTNCYRVQAFNSAGSSEFSDATRIALIPPAAPAIVTAAVLSAHRVDVSWDAAHDFTQGFKLERALDNGGTPGAWTLLADLPVISTYTTYSDIAVVMNQGYWYRVQSYNWSGASPYSNPFLVVDAPPAAPSPLTVTNDQPHQFTLTWAITNINITSIKIERAPDNSGAPGAWIQIAEPPTYCGLIPTNYTDIGIPTGQTFWYRVRAVNAVDDSPYSNEASGTEGIVTPALSGFPTPPQILSLSFTNGGALIQWSSLGGSTDVVQAAGDLADGYTNISPPLTVGGSGITTTNYFDAGVLTNSPSRFYRIRSSR